LSQLNWSSPLTKLSKTKSKSIDALINSGHETIWDLLSIFPLKTESIPPVRQFQYAEPMSLFKGVGKVLSLQERPNFKNKGRGGVPLINVNLIVQDNYSSATLSLKWFNLYPTQAKMIREHNQVHFLGSVSEYQGIMQVMSPDVTAITDEDIGRDINNWDTFQVSKNVENIKVSYPTVSGVSPHHVKGIMKKIPTYLWECIEDTIPRDILIERDLYSLEKVYLIIHGKCSSSLICQENLYKCHERLLYNELINNQVKLFARKASLEEKKGIILKSDPDFLNKNTKLFPYNLTEDQIESVQDIVRDFTLGSPMMRLIQGDVGCGKTTVALLTALFVSQQGYQVAIMCPTESLAYQHYTTFSETLSGVASCSILVSGLDKKTKDINLSEINKGKAQIVIGTHSLIQKNVHFKKLAYVIIDEQHKFGVQQRIELVSKGAGVHCALMTATPIPRSLRLTQYGDLSISIIKNIPSGRKGTQTKIVNSKTYSKYLSFLKTRIEMGEQAYVVVPAVLENEEQDMLNLEFVLKKYKEYFPDLTIKGLHGKMKSDEKKVTFDQFKEKSINILISTSVIEVGINNLNATVMAILSPERFGLSSLHQMRGRVGRGKKPGFCFLVNDKEISEMSQNRLKVIEQNTDGFIIADEDLKARGEGDLFGKEQSGSKIASLLVNVIERPDILEWADQDAQLLKRNFTPMYQRILKSFSNVSEVTKTI
jgi:ATP-dependent DNA helicase RecG